MSSRSCGSAARRARATLEPGERIEASAYVAQRHPLDYFRETYGTLAATDRRLIFIGVLPRDFLEPERDLPAFDVRTFPYDTTLLLRGARVFFGRTYGVVLHTDEGDEAFSELADGVLLRVAEVDDFAGYAIGIHEQGEAAHKVGDVAE